jgi:hypothetical protein
MCEVMKSMKDFNVVIYYAQELLGSMIKLLSGKTKNVWNKMKIKPNITKRKIKTYIPCLIGF